MRHDRLSLLDRLRKPWFVYRPLQLVRRVYRSFLAAAPGYQPLQTSWGVRVLADPTKNVGASIRQTGVYDVAVSEVLARLIDSGDTVVDAGANVGYMTLLAATAAGPGGTVLAFEPHPELFAVLKRNARSLNQHVHAAAIESCNAALGDRPGTAQLVWSAEFEANDGVARIAADAPRGGGAVPVAVTTLDQALGTRSIAVLKIDVEGFELDVLRGAALSLEQRRVKHIVFEDHDVEKSGVVRYLQGLGYRVFSLGWSMQGPVLAPIDAGRIAADYEPPNYVASLAPDEVLSRCAARGWVVLSHRLLERCGRVIASTGATAPDREASSQGLRILHVGKFYPPARGGMEKVVQTLCESERAVVDSCVLVANDRGMRTVREEHHGVPVTRVATLAAIGSVGVCPTFPFWMRRLDADVMVIHEPNPLALVCHVLARPKARLVIWFHSEVVRPRWKYFAIYRPFLRRALRLADRIVVAAPRLAECASELQDFRDKCVAIPFGIDPDQHAATDDNRARIDEIRAEDPRPLVLFVGRMVPYKGVDVLLRALAGVAARAILVGDGRMGNEWQRLATDLGLGDRVRFTGEMSPAELTAHYQACDIFVLPSVTPAEAFGMVQLEAMACGKPVVSTDVRSGVPWVNQHGETGIVVPPNDATALQMALNTLVNDAALRARMGAAGRARVLSTFTIPRMVDQMTTVYRELARNPREHEKAKALRLAN